MKVAICDDERESCSRLCNLIKKQKYDCEVKCFYTGRQFWEARESFDILILDIQMEGMSGIEVARTLRVQQENTILIFVTALREYVPEAFDVSAFHYLLKPVPSEKFCRVFESAYREAQKREAGNVGRLFFQTRSRSFTVQKKEVLYIESKKRKVDIHTLKECFTVYATMRNMEERLGQDFYRCHRGYLVNMAYVKEYSTDIIRLKTGDTVYMSREKSPEFAKVYLEYLKRGGTACV